MSILQLIWSLYHVYHLDHSKNHWTELFISSLECQRDANVESLCPFARSRLVREDSTIVGQRQMDPQATVMRIPPRSIFDLRVLPVIVWLQYRQVFCDGSQCKALNASRKQAQVTIDQISWSLGNSFIRWSYRQSCVRQCYYAAAACPTPNRTTNSCLRRLRLPPATATTVPGGYRVWPPGRQVGEGSSVVGYACQRYSRTVGCRSGTCRPSTTGMTWETASTER